MGYLVNHPAGLAGVQGIGYDYVLGSGGVYVRYWELKQPLNEALIRRLSLQIHYEILKGIREAVISTGQPSETVEDRVERALEDAILPANEMAYIIGSDKQEAVEAYLSWVLGHETNEEALADAFQKDFQIGDEFMNSAARQAFETLANATDPAVKCLARVLSVLPKQQRDATPCVEWMGPQQFVFGRVHTPGGTTLGHIERNDYSDFSNESHCVFRGQLPVWFAAPGVGLPTVWNSPIGSVCFWVFVAQSESEQALVPNGTSPPDVTPTDSALAEVHNAGTRLWIYRSSRQ